MKNTTWAYLYSDAFEINLHNTKYLKVARFLEREDKDQKVVAQVVRLSDGKIHINVWYWPDIKKFDENTGKLIASIETKLKENQKECIYINLPKTDNWEPLQPYYKDSENEGLYFFEHYDKDDYETRCKFTMYSDKSKGKEVIKAVSEVFPTPKEAKKQFKYIKKHHLVSKFYWDRMLGHYDCKCLACQQPPTGVNKYGWSSWVSNPDIGFVRPVGFKCEEKDNVFTYKSFGGKQKLYEPCKSDEYERLCFFNKKEFKEETKDKGVKTTFTKCWDTPLTQSDIDSNGNIIGGAWRDLKTGEIIGRETDDILDETAYERVVTLGWHRTEIKGAVRCPVCDDLYVIICRSGYDPMSFFLKLRSMIVTKASYLKIIIGNKIYDWKHK